METYKNLLQFILQVVRKMILFQLFKLVPPVYPALKDSKQFQVSIAFIFHVIFVEIVFCCANFTWVWS